MPKGDRYQKARQRARNGGTNSGSSGISLFVSRMERREWEDIEPHVVAGHQFAALVQDQRILANRSLMVTLVVPPEYAHEVVDAVMQSGASIATWVKLFHVPVATMLPAVEDDEDDGDLELEGA